MLSNQENQLPGPLKSSDIKIPTTVAIKLKLLMEYKQEEKNKAESQGNSDIRSILNELHEFKMDLKELKTLNELQEIKTDLTELKSQLCKSQEDKNKANSDIRSILDELQLIKSDKKSQGNSDMRSVLNELQLIKMDQKSQGNNFKNEFKMDLSKLETQLAKLQFTILNTNKATTPLKK